MLTFVVPGEPCPKGRARSRPVTMPDGRTIVSHYTPKETRDYEKKVREICQLAVNQARWTSTPNERFRVLMRVFRTHEGAGGDADNYQKAILDAINKVAYPDDRYVRQLGAVLGRDAANPRIEVTVTKLGRE